MGRRLLAFADNASVNTGAGYHSPYVDAVPFKRLHLIVSGNSIQVELASLLDDGVTVVPTTPSPTVTSSFTYSVGPGTITPIGFGRRVKVVLVLVGTTPQVVKYELWGEE